MTGVDFVSIILAFCCLAVILGSFYNRHKAGRGIGWQFIRYNVIALAIPVCAILALNGALNGEAAGIIGAAVGYAFGKSSEGSSSKSNSDS
ncbi:hypothetical protein IWQ51_006825 [Labrenzia sp. EL_142]|nr:hypothetical protein [Labrenzia sp. EL_142]